MLGRRDVGVAGMYARWRCCDIERTALVISGNVMTVAVPSFRKCSFNPMNSIQQTLQDQQDGQTPVGILEPLGS